MTRATHTFVFDTPAEAEAFARGVAFVNDSAISIDHDAEYTPPPGVSSQGTCVVLTDSDGEQGDSLVHDHRRDPDAAGAQSGQNVYTIPVPVLTTAHLPETDIRRLEELASDQGEDWLIVADYGAGFFVRVCNPDGPLDFTRDGFSGHFGALAGWVYEAGREFVRLDADCGDQVEGLELFDW